MFRETTACVAGESKTAYLKNINLLNGLNTPSLKINSDILYVLRIYTVYPHSLGEGISFFLNNGD